MKVTAKADTKKLATHGNHGAIELPAFVKIEG